MGFNQIPISIICLLALKKMNTIEKLVSFLKAPSGAEAYADIKLKDFGLLLLLTLLIVVPYAFILEWTVMKLVSLFNLK